MLPCIPARSWPRSVPVEMALQGLLCQSSDASYCYKQQEPSPWVPSAVSRRRRAVTASEVGRRLRPCSSRDTARHPSRDRRRPVSRCRVTSLSLPLRDHEAARTMSAPLARAAKIRPCPSSAEPAQETWNATYLAVALAAQRATHLVHERGSATDPWLRQQPTTQSRRPTTTSEHMRPDLPRTPSTSSQRVRVLRNAAS